MADPQAQRDQDVVAYTAFAGVRNDVAPERLAPSDLALGDNVDLDQSGRLSRRAGYTQRVAGATHSLWADPAQEICLYVAGGALRQLAPDLTSAARLTLADGAARMSYVRVNERVYFSNGVETGILENGAVRTWGLAVPPTPGVAVTVGNMPAGLYQYALTWLRADGQESGAALAGRVDVPEGGGLNLTLPVAVDPTVVAKVLYLTTPNGETLYEAAVPFPNALTAAYYGNDANELATPLDTQFLQAAPAGQLVAYHRGRLFVAVGSVLYMSEPYAYELFDLRQHLDLDARITMLAPLIDKEQGNTGINSGMFIGTDKSCGALIGMGPDDFQYVPKQNYGALLGALDYVDGSQFNDGGSTSRQLPIWLSTRGICVGMPSMQVQNLTLGRYLSPMAGQGAALFMPGSNRFMATGNL